MDLLQTVRSFVFRSLLLVGAGAGSALTALAQSPQVAFDIPFVITCRDVTSPEFSSAHPGDKLIEVKLPISSLLQAGSEQDLGQYFVRMESPQRTMQVVDFLPKTAHESRLAGNKSVQTTDETTASIGINASGHYETFTGGAVTSGLGKKYTSCVKYDLLPPLETVTASGTMQRGSGVYFKLKASERNLLEGQRDFALVLQVPSSWRADYLHIRCEAEGVVRGLVSSLDEKTLCGQRDFLVSLHLAGDEPARRTAEAFSRAETSLRKVAHVKGKEIEKRSYPTLAKQIGLMFDSASPAIPKDWLARLLFGPVTSSQIPKKLPREVVQAAQEFQLRRQQLAAYSGWGETASVSSQPSSGLAAQSERP